MTKIMKNKISFRIPKVTLVLMYAAASLALTISHDWFIDSRMLEVRKTIHEQVLAQSAPAPIQYRVLVYYAAEGLMRLGVPLRESYDLIRFVFLFLSCIAFHALLSLWFSGIVSLAGVLYLLAVLPLTFIRYYMQPMDIPNLFFFLAGCLLIAGRKDWLLVPLVFVAMLNRETAVLLVLVYFFFRCDELPAKDLFLRSGAIFATGMGTYWALRKLFSIKHYYADLFYLDGNLASVHTYLYALALSGPFVYLAFKGFREKPKFLRRSLLFIPFFLIIHFTMTIMVEPRLWLPVLPLLIAAGLWAFVPGELKAGPLPEPAPVNNFLARFPRLNYAFLLAVFLVFFAGFFVTYKNLHMKDRDLQKRVEALITSARRYADGGWYGQAVMELDKALVYAPANDTAHYELALLYDNNIFDPRKAIYHFEKCLELNPYHLDNRRIKSELERLKFTSSK
ncbi:MAG: tetratricopeptide repeat protein [Endomicrobiales bacterium]